MARLGMLYSITDEELFSLEQQTIGEMYNYMLEHVERQYFGTTRACELNKAWEGIHFCLNSGEWLEGENVESKVVFGGSVLLDYNDHVITLKAEQDVEEITAYLAAQDLGKTIHNNFEKIDSGEYTLPKDKDNLAFLLGWCEGIKAFYEMAQAEKRNVIFTVDL